MTLTNISPRTEEQGLRAREARDPWEELFDRMLAPWQRSALWGANGQYQFTPAIDVTYDDHEIVMKAELPGVSKDDIELTVQDNALTLKGLKHEDTERKEGGRYYSERRFGEFVRSFQLPSTADASKIQADFKDGVLKVSIPFAETAKPRKVDIQFKS